MTAGPTSTTTLLDQVCADLDDPARRIRFSDPIEQRFQSSRKHARIQHFVKSSVIGLLSFNLFLISDAFIVRDILWFAIILHLAVVTPIAILVVYLVHREKLPTDIVAFNLTMTLGTALADMHLSHSPDAIFLLFTMPIFYIYGNIVLPFPFRLAVQFSIFCVTVTAASIAVQRQIHLGAKILIVLSLMIVAAYTLIATYRSEVFERRSYLLTLREVLRGETLVEQNRQLSELSETDQLTGVANRRVFDRNLEQLWRDHQQSRTPLALLMIDIDHFKKLNDTYGHASGDICLRRAADRLRRLMRPHQSLARYGGEEFVVLLEGEGAFCAEEVAERLRSEIEVMPILLAGTENKPHHITISVGCATIIPRVGLSPGELFAAADKALYAAKHGGRNRVHADAPLVVSEPAAAVAPVLRRRNELIVPQNLPKTLGFL